MQLDRLRPIPIMLAFLMVATACGGGDTVRGVQVRDLSTDIGLGIEEVGTETGSGSGAAFGRSFGGTFIPPKFEFTPGTIDRVGDDGADECKEAGPLDFPNRGAETSVGGTPKESTSRWVIEATALDKKGNRGHARLLDMQREVRNVRSNPLAKNAYEFEVKETRPAILKFPKVEIITRWLVLPQGPSQQAGVENEPPPAADPAERQADQAGVGREDEGIYLTYLQQTEFTQAAEPTVVRQILPNPPIQYLSFPVRQGGYIDSTGTDGATEMRIQGRIERRRDVDACGEKIASWYVNAVQTWRDGTSTEQSNYDYGIATQFGGIIVSECYEVPVGDNPDRVCHDDPIPPALEKDEDPAGTVTGTDEGCSLEDGETQEEKDRNYQECRAEEQKQQNKEEEERRKRMKRLENPDFRIEYRVGAVPPPAEEFENA